MPFDVASMSMAVQCPAAVTAFLAGGAIAYVASAMLPEVLPQSDPGQPRHCASPADDEGGGDGGGGDDPDLAEQQADLQRERDERRQAHEQRMKEMREEGERLQQQQLDYERQLADRRSEVNVAEQRLLQEQWQLQARAAAAQDEHEQGEWRLQAELARVEHSRAERQERNRELQRQLSADWPKPHFFHGHETGINIGVAGASGAGKSSFINCMLGLKPGDPKAAKTGVTECTQEPMPYSTGTATLWDLPGAGTKVPQDTYMKEMGLRYFDILVIVNHPRFGEIDQMLFREARIWQIPVFLVRNKADMDMEMNLEDNGVPPSDTLQSLRQELVGSLQRGGSFAADHRVFIISTRKDKFAEELEPELVALTKVLEDTQEQSLNRPSSAAAAGELPGAVDLEPHQSVSSS